MAIGRAPRGGSNPLYGIIIGIALMFSALVLAFLAVIAQSNGFANDPKRDQGNEKSNPKQEVFVAGMREYSDTGSNGRRQILHSQTRGQSPGGVSEGNDVD